MIQKRHVFIREFKEEDAQQVSKVIRESMMTTNTKDYPLSILQPLHDYFTPAKVKVLASERYCLVALYQKKVVGTGAIEDNELKTIFVLPAYQRLGIGSKLIKQLESYALTKQITEIKVPASISGIGFYERVGYEKGNSFISKHAGQQTWMTKKL